MCSSVWMSYFLERHDISVFKIYIYICILFERVTKRKKETENFPFTGSLPQMAATARGEPCWSRERPWVFYMDVVGQVLGSIFAAFPGALPGSRIGSGGTVSQTITHMECQHHRQQLYPLYHIVSPSVCTSCNRNHACGLVVYLIFPYIEVLVVSGPTGNFS